ncbi:MAG TPA: hypothetical protein VHP38_08960, partial [Ruminiclostridium sp.]|nr:hypothetical protein [Ruminiclostridium sp.]
FLIRAHKKDLLFKSYHTAVQPNVIFKFEDDLRICAVIMRQEKAVNALFMPQSSLIILFLTVWLSMNMTGIKA